jgi:hypothetical protein
MTSYLPKREAGGRTLSATELTNPTKATGIRARQRAGVAIWLADFRRDSSTASHLGFVTLEGDTGRFVT